MSSSVDDHGANALGCELDGGGPGATTGVEDRAHSAVDNRRATGPWTSPAREYLAVAAWLTAKRSGSRSWSDGSAGPRSPTIGAPEVPLPHDVATRTRDKGAAALLRPL